MKNIYAIICLIVLNCLTTIPVSSQWNPAVDIAISTAESVSQPAILRHDNLGGVWIIWREQSATISPDSTLGKIQHLDINGYATLSTGGIFIDSLGFQQGIAAAEVIDDTVLYVVYFTNERDGFSHTPRVYYTQKFTISGDRVWEGKGKPLIDFYSSDTWVYRVITTSEGGYYLLYYVQEKQFTPIQKYVQKISKEGEKLWGDRGVNLNGKGAELCKDINDGIIVAESNSNEDTIFYNRIDSSGKFLFSSNDFKIRIPTLDKYGHNSVGPIVQPFNNGVVMYINAPVEDSSLDRAIFIAQFDSLGTSVTDWKKVVDGDHSGYSRLWMFPADSGSLVYFFQAEAGKTSPIYVRKVSVTGEDKWGSSKLVGWADSSSRFLTVSESIYGYFAAWDRRSLSYAYQPSNEIYTQLIDHNGKKMWSDSGVWVGADSNLFKLTGKGTIDNYGNCFVCWNTIADPTLFSIDLYCTKIDRLGYIPTITRSVKSSSAKSVAVRISPNPTHSVIHIDSKSELVRKVIATDILGRDMMVFEGNSDMINLKQLPRGKYILSVFLDSGVERVAVVLE